MSEMPKGNETIDYKDFKAVLKHLRNQIYNIHVQLMMDQTTEDMRVAFCDTIYNTTCFFENAISIGFKPPEHTIHKYCKSLWKIINWFKNICRHYEVEPPLKELSPSVTKIIKILSVPNTIVNIEDIDIRGLDKTKRPTLQEAGYLVEHADILVKRFGGSNRKLEQYHLNTVSKLLGYAFKICSSVENIEFFYKQLELHKLKYAYFLPKYIPIDIDKEYFKNLIYENLPIPKEKEHELPRSGSRDLSDIDDF